MTHLRLIETHDCAARPPRPRRLEVRLSVRDGREPFGRSRVFRLHWRDLDELVAAAARLESC